jgi:hypothetical protein
VLRQEELGSINIEFSPVFLQELWKTVVASKKKKALVASKANAMSALALECLSGVRSEALSYCDSPQFPVSIRKADEPSRSDSLSEPASCHPVPRHLIGYRARGQGSMCELGDKSSQQL